MEQKGWPNPGRAPLFGLGDGGFLAAFAGKLLLGVLAAVAEFEKALIIERTKEGLARAKAQGKRLGRPPGSKDKRKRSKRG